jgi:hypothetical protein
LTQAATLIWMIPVMSIIWLLELPRYGSGSIVPVAIVGATMVDLAVASGAFVALGRLTKRDLSRRRALLAAGGIYVATFVAVMAAYSVALALVRG